MRDILQTLCDRVAAGRPLVMCSLVETRGSTPQKAGASMLVFPDGTQSGTLGGGCVEAEVKQRALALAEHGAPEILTFNLDDNYGWDDGLICGGRMRILAEPIHGRDALDYFSTFRAAVERGDGCTEAVVLENSAIADAIPTARLLFGPARDLLACRRAAASPQSPGEDKPDNYSANTKNGGKAAMPAWVEHVAGQLPTLGDRPRPGSRNGIAFLPVLPRARLIIVGAGHVGQAVADLAAQADFEVWVIDDRDRYANPERFPRAALIVVDEMATALPRLEVDSRSFVIIVTRGHQHDEEALFHLAAKPSCYIGMIGSRRKIRLIFDDLLAAGVAPDLLDRVHAPLGIDIGSQTVPEIAVSIVAELIAVRNLGLSPGRDLAANRRANLEAMSPRT